MLEKLAKTATPFYLSLWPGLTRWELIFRVSVSEYKLGLLPHGLVICSLITIKHRSKNLKGSHQRRSLIWFYHSIFFSQRQEENYELWSGEVGRGGSGGWGIMNYELGRWGDGRIKLPIAYCLLPIAYCLLNPNTQHLILFALWKSGTTIEKSDNFCQSDYRGLIKNDGYPRETCHA